MNSKFVKNNKDPIHQILRKSGQETLYLFYLASNFFFVFFVLLVLIFFYPNLAPIH